MAILETREHGWIMGLDTDITKTGIVLLPLEGDEPVFSACLKPPGVFRWRSFYTRGLIFDFLCKHTNTALSKVKLCGIEAISAGGFNPGYAIIKGQHYGILAAWFLALGIELMEYCPPQRVKKGRKSPLMVSFIPPIWVKMWATGKAKADKAVIMKAVLKKWGQDFETNDEADAYILARIAREVYLWEHRKESVVGVGFDAWCAFTRELTATQEKILKQILTGREKLREVQGG